MKENLYKIIAGSLIVGSSFLPSRALGIIDGEGPVRTIEEVEVISDLNTLAEFYIDEKSGEAGLSFSILREAPYDKLWNIAKFYGVEGDSNLVKAVNEIVYAQDNKWHSESFLRRINQDKYSVIGGNVVERPDGILGDIAWPEDIFKLNRSDLESLSQYGFRFSFRSFLPEQFSDAAHLTPEPVAQEKTSRRTLYFATAFIGIGLALVAYSILRTRSEYKMGPLRD